jgi:hypothetical protein
MREFLFTVRSTSANSTSLASTKFHSQPKISSLPLPSSTLLKPKLEFSLRVLTRNSSLHVNRSSMRRARVLISVMKIDLTSLPKSLMTATLRKVLE